MSSTEDSSSSLEDVPSIFVGCDENNRWAAVEVHGLCGGIFADQASALKFAFEAAGHRKGAVRLVAHVSPFPAIPRHPA